MKNLAKALAYPFFYVSLGLVSSIGHATDNQTDQLSPILPVTGLPFRVTIEQTNFQLPAGVHSGLFGVYQGLWVFIAGSTIGLHGFGPNPFPPEAQNRNVYVVNPNTGLVLSRSLDDPSSGLTPQQVDSLSTISPQGYQANHTLYMTGGYGLDRATGTRGTKPVFTAINLPGVVKWVTEPGNSQHSVVANIRQLYNPIFQITGGAMFQLGGLTQLIFGQNFTGNYTDGSNGIYSEQVRQFQIKDVGGQLLVDIYNSKPYNPDPNFRRRDLNIVPTLLNNSKNLEYGFVAYSGVFTPAGGIWTVPVVLRETGDPVMADPNSPNAFKQAMNNYASATAGVYSKKTMNMYHILFGGISYGYYANGVFQTDSEIPFINQVTTVKMDRNGTFTQYLMDSEYPVILSTQANPGNPLLFGAGAYFVPNNILKYPNSVISLDTIRRPTVIGYIVGGIQSTVPNTNVITDSSASPYVFKVTLIPTQ